MIFLAISLVLVFILVVCTVVYGVIKKKRASFYKSSLKRVLKVNMIAFTSVVSFSILFLIPKIILGLTSTVGTAQTAAATANPAAGLGYIASGICTGLACVGSGYAVGHVGAAGIGAMSEDQTLFGKTLIYVGLGEGIAIYGLLISILILFRL
ncbi:MAG: ATP synthase subunit C [Oscillospiraceae bacterium]|nr:ATP synthase subunit C [Oscillospiraceae bacterium]